jgi:hypothetical protein
MIIQIFDIKIPHLNDDLDVELREGSLINCIIVRNKLSELKYKNENLKRDEFLQLSLKNTLIKNSKQYYLHDYLKELAIPVLLGVDNISENGKWIDNKTLLKDHIYNNETILSNLLSDLKINQFGLRAVYKTNSESGFTYEKYYFIILG